jgi:hypothetical protein
MITVNYTHVLNAAGLVFGVALYVTCLFVSGGYTSASSSWLSEATFPTLSLLYS